MSAVSIIRQQGKSTSKVATAVLAADELRASRLSPKTCTADDVCSLMERYARTHGRTAIAVAGQPYLASVSGVVGLQAGLRQVFTDAGRDGGSVAGRGSYLADPTTGLTLGNPADSAAVREFVTGYRQIHFDHGNDAVPAVPMKLGKLAVLSSDLAVGVCEALARGATGEAFLLARDRSAFLAAYGGKDRAGEAGKLRLSCLLQDCSAQTTAVRFEAAARGQDLTAHGRGKKQARARCTATYQMPDLGDSRVDPGAALCVYVELGFALQVFDSGADDFFIFPVSDRKGGFDCGRPMDAKLVTSRLQTHLKRLGIFAGETSHSLKRGAIVDSPLSDSAIAKLASLSEQTIRLYRDLGRRHRGEV